MVFRRFRVHLCLVLLQLLGSQESQAHGVLGECTWFFGVHLAGRNPLERWTGVFDYRFVQSDVVRKLTLYPFQIARMQLQEFKKGPFYLREDINKNVVPALVFGAYELWPPGRLFALPGKVGHR